MASLRRAVDDMSLRSCGPKTLWNKLIPLEVRIFIWKVRIDRIPTKINLIQRGITIKNDCCAFCNEPGETSNHLLINCRKAMEIRRVVNEKGNLLPIHCSSLADFFELICNKEQTTEWRSIREVLGQAYLWALWNERNGIIFNGKTFNPRRTSNDMLISVKLWLLSRDASGNIPLINSVYLD